MDIQQKVNHLSALVRLESIEYLVKEDRIKCGALPLSEDELTIFKRLESCQPVAAESADLHSPSQAVPLRADWV